MKAFKLSCPNCDCKLLLTIEDDKKPVISALNPEPEPEQEIEQETGKESVIEQNKKSKQLKLFVFDDNAGE